MWGAVAHALEAGCGNAGGQRAAAGVVVSCGIGRGGGLGERIKYLGFHLMGWCLVGFFTFGPGEGFGPFMYPWVVCLSHIRTLIE